jgi:O-antigen/teichoic acid export membrane protein
VLNTKINIDRLKKGALKFLGQDAVEVLRHFNNYFWGALVGQGLVFLSIPVFTRLLSPADYGIFQVFRSYASILIIVLTLNFHGSIARYFYDEPHDYKEFVGTSILGSILLLAFASVCLLFFHQQVADFLGLPDILLLLLLPFTLIKIFDSAFSDISVARKDSFRYALVNNGRTVLGFGLGIGLVFASPRNEYLGPVLGQVGAGVLIAIYIVWLLRGQIAWGPNRDHVKYIFSYSLPLVPYLGSSLLLDQLDRILINKNLGATDAGLYSFAYNVGMVVSLATDAMHTAFVPDWFRLMREKKYNDINTLINKLFRVTLVVAFGVILFSKEIVHILSDKDYHAALSILPIVVVGYVFDNLSKVYLRSIGFTNKMLFVSLIGIITVVINFLLNIIYLPRYGYVAGAYVTVISFVVLFLLAWVVSKHILKQPVTPLRVFRLPFLLFGVGVTLYYVFASSGVGFIYSFSLRCLLFAVFVVALILVGEQRRRINVPRMDPADDASPDQIARR